MSDSSTDNSDFSPNPYITVFILSIATFMEVLDTTIANVALPKIASGLSITINEASWITGSYLVANAAIVPISAWVATYFGRRRYYMVCVFCFTLASLFCALSPNIETLVFFRILQGLSGGGLAASEQAILADTTPPDKLGRIFSIYAFAVMVGPISGPVLGGFITDTLSWHWVFLINVPIGIVSLLLTSAFVKESDKARERTEAFRREGKTIDWVGIILFISGIACLELFFDFGPKEGWLESDFVLLLGVAAVLSLLIGITWEYYQDQPAVDITLFKYRNFAGAALLVFTLSLMSTGSVFLFPFMAQTLFGYSATNSGLIFLPGTLIMMVMVQIVGWLIDKYDVRYIIAFGLFALSYAQWNLSSLTLQADYTTLVWARVYQSFGLSFLAASINTAAYTDMPSDKVNGISAFMNLARNTGSSFGVAIASTLIITQTQVHVNNLSYHTSNFNPNYVGTIKNLLFLFQQQGYTAVQSLGIARGVMWNTLTRQASMLAFIDAFQLYAVLLALMFPLVFLLKRKKKKPAEQSEK
ncbi:MAG: DHA2 family efflux MFS transporter permease subunit [Pyrinomonadaceae bacterium]